MDQLVELINLLIVLEEECCSSMIYKQLLTVLLCTSCITILYNDLIVLMNLFYICRCVLNWSLCYVRGTDGYFSYAAVAAIRAIFPVTHCLCLCVSGQSKSLVKSLIRVPLISLTSLITIPHTQMSHIVTRALNYMHYTLMLWCNYLAGYTPPLHTHINVYTSHSHVYNTHITHIYVYTHGQDSKQLTFFLVIIIKIMKLQHVCY